MPPNKLKQGFGDGVCQVLIALGHISLENRFKFKRPNIQKDDGGFGDDGDDDMGGDEYEGTADVADMARDNFGAADEGEDIDEELDFGGAGGGVKYEQNEDEMLQ